MGRYFIVRTVRIIAIVAVLTQLILSSIAWIPGQTTWTGGDFASQSTKTATEHLRSGSYWQNLLQGVTPPSLRVDGLSSFEVVARSAHHTFWPSLIALIIATALMGALFYVSWCWSHLWWQSLFFAVLAIPTFFWLAISVSQVGLWSDGWQAKAVFCLLLGWRSAWQGAMVLLHAAKKWEHEHRYFYLYQSFGASRSQVFFHQLQRLILPLLLLRLVHLVVAVFGGSVLIESFFGFSGLGQLFLESILERDWAVVILLVQVFAILWMFGQLLHDCIQRQRLVQ